MQLVWVIDPARETVTVLQPGTDARVLIAGDTLDGGTLLPNFNRGTTVTQTIPNSPAMEGTR